MTIELSSDRLVRVRDLAHVAQGSDLVVLRAPRSRAFSLQQQAQLVRNRLPGAVFTLRHLLPVRFTFPDRLPTDLAACSSAASLIPAGRILEPSDLVSINCSIKPQGSWLTPVAGGHLAKADIPAGTPLGRPQLSTVAPVARATPVVFRTSIGSVTIERSAATVQPGRPGRPVFARTADGSVIVAPLETGETEERP